ncbi:MAG: hypothetical protein PUB21_09920 [Bacteroidales bacterium]|nr:hypothetical protein [Bacteroidales bacterium]
MKVIRFILNFIFKYLKWFILVPLVVGLLLIYYTANLTRKYEAHTTIYTGIVSGFSVNESASNKSYFSIENAIDNLKTIFKANATLENVCLKLFAQSMIYGDLENDNRYITAKSFRRLWNIVPLDVKALIDKTSIDRTVENLRAYKTDDADNFIYGLIFYEHPDYSIQALSKATITRKGNSDMLEISYSSYDPALAYQTVLIFTEEFKKKYQELQFSETNNVVDYFRAELVRQRKELRTLEDSLMVFKQQNKIIEYDQQTREIASMDATLTKALDQSTLMKGGSSDALNMLDIKIGNRNHYLQEHTNLVDAIEKESLLTDLISKRESLLTDSLRAKDEVLLRYKKQLADLRSSLQQTADNIGEYQTSSDGVVSTDILNAYLLENINKVKATSEINILKNRSSEMDKLYNQYSVIGATLKRMEREIMVAEHSYLNILDNLNQALQRQKNLQLSSATLQVITPAVFPVHSMPSKRKMIVVGGTVGSFIFIIALLLLYEIINVRLNNPERAERLTGKKVFSPFPFIRKNEFGQPIEILSINYICNMILARMETDKDTVINLLSLLPGEGKSFLGERIAQFFKEKGYSVSFIQYGKDFDEHTRIYDYSQSTKELLPIEYNHNCNLEIIEHPAASQESISRDLLVGGALNLLVCDARRSWTWSDKMLLEDIDQKGDIKLGILLNNVKKNIMENYTGLIPPYTTGHKLVYDAINLDIKSIFLDIIAFVNPYLRRNKGKKS